ncbi:hypothetical protein Vretimale_15133 [Volvox reticuliferus]|uniref:SnoaL-like domain-containing protein n=1 Tax=Volvox reticuliferus TaxID=1737510 RepID=A0A8J4GQ09_9CHLO|nr:hypothetical protein Vretifemale_5361 [Volvox reticuliferus]GIM11703.1 hypothetical protein Vretimale_15133 [Volvox reticuliferus]
MARSLGSLYLKSAASARYCRCPITRNTCKQFKEVSAHQTKGVACKAVMAQEAAAIVQKQLELYNARQVDSFMELFTDDVVVLDGITGAIIASSKEELRPRYIERFKSPVHCELLGRLVLGNVVVDREIITGLPNEGVADCMATYVCDIAADKIKRITFVWQPRTDGVKL